MAKLSIKTKSFLAKRARGCCEYCKSQMDYSPATFSGDHIIATSKGGNDDMENLAWTCSSCNGFKYNHLHGIDPISGERVRLFHPRNDVWEEHFTWSDDFSIIEGITSIGRATITRLKMNRQPVVNLRLVLVESDKHPPT